MGKFEELYESFMNEEKNYVDNIKSTPKEVQEIINNAEDSDDYRELQKVVDELKNVGWEADYDLNGIMITLKPNKALKESKGVTVAEIDKAFRDIDTDTAKEVKKLMVYPGSASKAEANIEKIDKLIEHHGVEVIRGEDVHDSYFQDAIALYSNSGDTYAPTIIYDIEDKEYLLTTVGDYQEKKEKEGIKFK